MKSSISLSLCLAISVLLTSCATALPDLRTFQDPRETQSYKDLLASGANIDFEGCPSFIFRSGHPKTESEDLVKALDPYYRKNFKEQLFNCLGLISRTPNYYLAIEGFASPAECSSDCQELSIRRARVVRRALLEMHFPEGQIACVTGKGSVSLLDLERPDAQINSRVELSFQDLGCKV